MSASLLSRTSRFNRHRARERATNRVRASQRLHVWSAALMLAVCCSAGGAGCPRMMQNMGPQLPRALPPNAPLNQVVDLINQNTHAIQAFSSTRARLSTPGAPSIDANLVYQRDRNFRLRGGTTFTGPEVDLGSNPELFWFWVKRNTPPALYFCRHQQFTGPARESLPVEPEWLIKALGIVSFDASELHQGPTPLHGGRIQIVSTQPGNPSGRRRVTVVDDARGVILEQHVYDERGSLLASAMLSQHARDPATGVIMPRRVQVRWPPAQLDMTIEFYDLAINRVVGDPNELFVKPTYPGFPDVDLADPRSLAPPPALGSAPSNGWNGGVVPASGYVAPTWTSPSSAIDRPVGGVASAAASASPSSVLPGSPPVYTPEKGLATVQSGRLAAGRSDNPYPPSTQTDQRPATTFGTRRPRAAAAIPPIGAVPGGSAAE